MELGQEIFHILKGEGPGQMCRDHTMGEWDSVPAVKPPSRNQNPLIKDRLFEPYSSSFGGGSSKYRADRDVMASLVVGTSSCGDGYMKAMFFSPPEIVSH